MKHMQPADRQQYLHGPYFTLSLSCFVMAVFYALSAGLTAAVFQEGHFSTFDPAQLIAFIPRHLALWRGCCFSFILAQLSFLFFVLSYQRLLEKSLQLFALFALLLVLIASATSLNTEVSMMVLFCDLALEIDTNYSQATSGAVHLSWAIMNQFLSHKILLSGILNAAAGLTLVVLTFNSWRLPAIIAWTGLPVFLAFLFSSLLCVCGHIDTGFVVHYFASIGLAFWASVVGFTCQLKVARRSRLLEEAELPG